MEILTACLCDSAADYQGKLCILGAFDTIWVVQFPAVHPQCSVALRLLLRDEDSGEHDLQIAFINPDGQSLVPAQNLPRLKFRVEPLSNEFFFASQNFVLNFQGLPVPAPGQYEIRISIDGKTAQTIPFQFVQRKPNA